MAKTIVIYHDEGVGEFGLSCLKRFFAEHDLRTANATAIIDNSALKDADLFIIPGGADLPYCQKLNGAGNTNIREFVQNGGHYLGICAGAYYACRAIEYHKGRNDEICEPRELALIDATAIGSLPQLAPYYDDRLRTVAAIDLHAEIETRAYYHGGCKFTLHEEAIIHARYDLKDLAPAIIEKTIGLGRAILSGVHLEISAQDVKDYPLEDEDAPSMLPLIMSRLKNSHELFRLILGREYFA